MLYKKNYELGILYFCNIFLCLGRVWFHQDAAIYYSNLSSLCTLYSYVQHR